MLEENNHQLFCYHPGIMRFYDLTSWSQFLFIPKLSLRRSLLLQLHLSFCYRVQYCRYCSNTPSRNILF